MPASTPFALLLQACGLSMKEAAALLDCRWDTVQSWSAGRRNPPAAVLAELAELAGRIDEAADAGVDELERMIETQGLPDSIELGLAADDAEAQSLGWPCVGAQAQVLALTVARLLAGWPHGDPPKIEIVPRGTTAATAAAANARERG